MVVVVQGWNGVVVVAGHCQFVIPSFVVEMLTGDQVIIDVVTLVAAALVEEERSALTAVHLSSGGSWGRMVAIGVRSC